MMTVRQGEFGSGIRGIDERVCICGPGRWTDLNGSAADGTINVNLGSSWSFGDAVGADQFDFVSAMMHEMMHAYGFAPKIEQAGHNTDTSWLLFDSAIVDRNGTSVIDDSYRFDTAFNANLTGGNGGLYFAGRNAATAYGGPGVPVLSPVEQGILADLGYSVSGPAWL